MSVAAPLEDLIVDAVLTPLDSPALADALAGKARTHPNTAALGAQIDAQQGRLDELAQLYAAKAITAREWILARDPISDTIGRLRRDIAHATDTGPLAELAGTGAALRGNWDDLTLDQQHAILRAVLDHVVIAPGKPGARTLDINRAQPHWRV